MTGRLKHHMASAGVFCGGAVWPLISLVFWDRSTGKAAISGECCLLASFSAWHLPSLRLDLFHVCQAVGCATWHARSMTVCFKSQHALCAAAIIGSSSGITSWLVSTYITQGSLTIINTEANGPLLAGNVISNVLSLLLLVSISLCFPEGRFDWNIFKEKITASDEEVLPSVVACVCLHATAHALIRIGGAFCTCSWAERRWLSGWVMLAMTLLSGREPHTPKKLS